VHHTMRPGPAGIGLDKLGDPIASSLLGFLGLLALRSFGSGKNLFVNLALMRRSSAWLELGFSESGEVPGLAAAAFQETVETQIYIFKLSREAGAISINS